MVAVDPKPPNPPKPVVVVGAAAAGCAVLEPKPKLVVGAAAAAGCVVLAPKPPKLVDGAVAAGCAVVLAPKPKLGVVVLGAAAGFAPNMEPPAVPNPPNVEAAAGAAVCDAPSVVVCAACCCPAPVCEGVAIRLAMSESVAGSKSSAISGTEGVSYTYHSTFFQHRNA